MSVKISGSQQILTSGGWQSARSLYSAYFGGAKFSIAYVEPTSFRTVKYMSVNQIYNHGLGSGVRLTSEDGSTCVVSSEGLVLDMAEDYPPRPTVRHPSDAKCLVGPNMASTSKYLVRRIDRREFVIINSYGIPTPNVICKGGFVAVG